MAEEKKKRKPGITLDYIPKEKLPREVVSSVNSSEELAQVPDSTLLAILLRTGTHDCNVVDLADALSHKYESLSELWRYPTISSFRQFLKESDLLGKGIGDDKIVALIAALELGKRAALRGNPNRKVPIKKARQVYDMVKPLANNQEEERFWILPLDYKNLPIHTTPILVHKGEIASTPVDLRVVYRIAVREGAEKIIAIHNHLDDNLNPSVDDEELTQSLITAGQTVNIKFLDHLIVSSAPDCEKCYSIVLKQLFDCSADAV